MKIKQMVKRCVIGSLLMSMTVGTDLMAAQTENPNVQLELAETEEENSEKVSEIFDDVDAGAWFENYVQYVYDSKIMTGLTEKKFGLNDPLARAQFAMIIWRMTDAPEMDYDKIFF